MNPIERGAEALWNRMLAGLPETARDQWRPWNPGEPGAIDWHHDARAVYESIDTDQLWETIQYAQQNGDDPALAVKNWLTGKVIQQ